MRDNPPCEMCGYGGDGEGPWLDLAVWWCPDCAVTHVLCDQCPEGFVLVSAFEGILDRCPRSPEVLVMLAVLNGGDG